MARFYAKFDSGSAGWVSVLDSTGGNDGYFNRKSIAANSASGALLRDGLIASRSLLSADIYEDLDSANRDGSKGTYFPPDSGPFSTNGSTFVSWSTAYSSSVDGIKTPVTNEYGVGDSINYSKRPTASILSTAATLVGPTTPIDPVGASYTTFINATNAVTAVLNAIQQTGGPNSRLGNFPSKTLHSLWHNPTLDYFAWDDFTPGTPQTYTVTSPAPGTGEYWYTNPFNYTLEWSGNYEYASDAIALPYVQTTFHETGSSTPIQTNGGVIIAPGAQQYIFTITVDPLSNGGSGEYELDTVVRFRDAKLNSKGNASDGIAATTVDANAIKLTRLFLYETLSYQNDAGTKGDCTSYVGGTYYTTVDDPANLNGEKGYTNTNSQSPSSAPIGNYIRASQASPKTVWSIDGAGAPFATNGTCTGEPSTTTTTTSTTVAPVGNCYEVTSTEATTVYWTSIDGQSRSDEIAASTTINICSQIRPFESPVADLFVSEAGPSCSTSCTDLQDACTPCSYP